MNRFSTGDLVVIWIGLLILAGVLHPPESVSRSDSKPTQVITSSP